ncbi:MAG: CRISPR-associated CARF protein Csa3 [Sulfolobales archaeon]
MHKTFIATLGFDQSPIVRLIGEKGLSDRDEIILITTLTMHPRTESAIQSIRDFVRKISPSVEVKVVRLDEKAFVENVVTLSKLISKVSYPVIDASGGPKMLALSLYIAACFSGIHSVHMTTETTGERVVVPALSTPNISLSDRQKEILSLLPARVSNLSKYLGISKSTVSRILRSLVQKGLIYKNPNKVYELTLTGYIIKTLILRGEKQSRYP